MGVFKYPHSKQTMLQIYSDGSCYPNPGGVGGFGYVAVKNGKVVKTDHGSVEDTTNNRMELIAAIKALEWSKDTEIKLFSDSQYLIRGATTWLQNWKKTNFRSGKIKNKDLWIQLDELIRDRETIIFEWVRGHNGDIFQEMAHELAEIGRLSRPVIIRICPHCGKEI